MRYARTFPLVAAALIGSASLPECANAQYALDRLFLEVGDATPLGDVLSFDSETEVANYYGATSHEAKLATEFFAGYSGSSANMLFTRYPFLPARAHLYGSNVSNLTLGELQAIKGSLEITSEGYEYTGSVNLSHVTSFSQAATAIQVALNRKLPVGAVTTGSSIAPVSVSFTGSINAAVLDVTALSSGAIEIGSVISAAGLPSGVQVTSQLSGTPNGVGVYGLFLHGSAQHDGSVPSETMNETYGVLTVGTVSSGTVAVGQEVSDAAAGVLPDTAIEANLSGSGAGSTWVVNNAQTVTAENMTTTGAPLSVVYHPVNGATESSGVFMIQQNGYFNYVSSSLTYASGTAAGSLGLTEASGAFLSSPGGIVTSPSAWMNNFIDTESDEWGSFQTTFNLRGAAASLTGEQDALEAWAQSTDGRYTYLENYWNTTPPIVNSLMSNVRLATGVPEPSTWAIALLGFASLGLARYRLRPRRA
jgi:Protein of unknown function (DUF3383)/PEP-CTERM motif